MIENLEEEINRLLKQTGADKNIEDNRLSISDNQNIGDKSEKNLKDTTYEQPLAVEESKNPMNTVKNETKPKQKMADIVNNLADKASEKISSSNTLTKKESNSKSKINTEPIVTDIEDKLQKLGENIDSPIEFFNILIDNNFFTSKFKTKNIAKCIPLYSLIIAITILWKIIDGSYDFIVLIPSVIFIVIILVFKEE